MPRHTRPARPIGTTAPLPPKRPYVRGRAAPLAQCPDCGYFYDRSRGPHTCPTDEPG